MAFASRAAGGLSRLAAWWIKLGIRPERIEPGKPQQNGRHERMHRTLKREAATPPQPSWARQQRAFDRFRGTYNYERPHEALGQIPPARVYVPSNRLLPAELDDPAYPKYYEHRRVQPNGIIRWRGERVFVSACLAGERVGLHEFDYCQWLVYFGPAVLGVLDENRRPWRLIRPRGKRKKLKVSMRSSV